MAHVPNFIGMKDFDDVMTRVGNHGPYQRWALAGIICPASILGAMTVNVLLFQVPIPEHWCHVPGRENTSYSVEAWKNLTIPRLEDSKLSKCHQYKVEWSEKDFIVHNETQGCAFGWDHDSSEFESTVATTHQWFCEKEGFSDHVYSISVAGFTVGTLVLPIIADRYIGRRLMFFVALLLYIVFTVPAVFVSNYALHLTLRFLSGLTFKTNFMMLYVIGVEFLSPETRAVATLVAFVAWTFGMCLTSLIAWLLPNWQYLALVYCLPSVLAFLYWWFVPESPRWLLSQGRICECATVLLQVAKSNGKEVSRAELESDLHILWNLQEKEVSLIEVLRYPVLRRRAAVLTLIGACTYLCYGVVFLGITVLSSNYFLSHFVLSISELPSNALGWVCIHYLGRRFTGIATFLTTAAFLAAAPFCRHDKWAMLGVVAIIRFFCTVLLYFVYVESTEIYPTPVRAMGLAWLFVVGFAVMTSTPYLLRSGISDDFPYWLLLSLMVVCALLGSVLPETIGLPLPQTFQDAEELGNGRPLKTWVHHWNQHKFVPNSSHEGRCQELTTLSNTNPRHLRNSSSS